MTSAVASEGLAVSATSKAGAVLAEPDRWALFIDIDGDGPSRTIVPGEYTIVVHYYSSNSGISTWPTIISKKMTPSE